MHTITSTNFQINQLTFTLFSWFMPDRKKPAPEMAKSQNSVDYRANFLSNFTLNKKNIQLVWNILTRLLRLPLFYIFFSWSIVQWRTCITIGFNQSICFRDNIKTTKRSMSNKISEKKLAEAWFCGIF